MSNNSLSTLLSATDLSTPSHYNVQRAAMLTQQIGAKLELVHVLDKNKLNELLQLIKGKKRQSPVRESLSKLTENINEQFGINARYHLEEGKVLERITACVRSLNANLLVIGAHGTGFFRRQSLGTTAERLLRMAQCPILTVKQHQLQPYRNILVPVDFSLWSLNSLYLALALAPKAKFTLLHVHEVSFGEKTQITEEKEEKILSYNNQVRQKADARIHQFAVKAGIPKGNWLPKVVIHCDTVDCVKEQESELSADLIVIGRRGLKAEAGMADGFMIGNTAIKILTHARCDVLVGHFH